MLEDEQINTGMDEKMINHKMKDLWKDRNLCVWLGVLCIFIFKVVTTIIYFLDFYLGSMIGCYQKQIIF